MNLSIKNIFLVIYKENIVLIFCKIKKIIQIESRVINICYDVKYYYFILFFNF